jgi:large subunit ribosomal protein L9|tara:strand:+ start:165 stop:629 length:465 start_codon:yes stop_codon:yes gene_type:complete
MQVILLENISKLGKIGDLVKVKNGYARNFLLKNNKALRANKENIELVNKNKSELTKKNIEIKNKHVEKANKIKNKKIKIYKAVKENGDLYASIKPKEISKIIYDELKTEIGPSEIIIKKEINKVGQFDVNIVLHSEVQTKISLLIEKLDKLQSK